MTRVLLAERLYPDWADGRRRAILNELNDRIAALLSRAGAQVVRVSDVREAARADAAALVLPGGNDVDPARYAAQPHPATEGVQPDQDDLDFALVDLAVSRGLPVLGICRGHQVLNVARGGTLIQDVAHDRVRHRPAGTGDLNDPDIMTTRFVEHDVELAEDSFLGRALGSHLRIASGHHQAVDRLGDGLVRVGWGDDGVVEAVEDPVRGLIGVQWHPESLGLEHGLFAAFVGRL